MTISLSKITALEAVLEYLVKAIPGERLEYLAPGEPAPGDTRTHTTPRGARGYYPSEVAVAEEEAEAPSELEPEEEREVEVVQAPEAKPESSSDVKPRKKAQLAQPIPDTATEVGQLIELKRLLPRIFHKGFKVSDFQDMYSTGLDDFSTIIEDIRTYDVPLLRDIEGAVTTTSEKKGIRIRVDIKDDLGQLAGRMTRSFKRVNGELRVNHHSFEIKPIYQGKGIAADINENVEEEYEKLGVYSIALSANVDIGGYAWARQGYDFVPTPKEYRGRPTELGQMKKRFREKISQLSSGRPPVVVLGKPIGGAAPGISADDAVRAEAQISKFKHAWEFAEWHFNGEHLGKEFMLGSNWHAKKILDKKSKGYKIGKAYFAAKRNEKNTS